MVSTGRIPVVPQLLGWQLLINLRTRKILPVFDMFDFEMFEMFEMLDMFETWSYFVNWLVCFFSFFRLTSHPDLGRSRGWPSCVHWWIRQRCLGWFRKCFLIEEGVLRCKFQSFCSKCGVALVLILETWEKWILVWRDWRDVQNLDFLNIERWARLQEELELILDSNWKAFRSTEATQCVIFLLVHIRLCRYKKAMPHI